jgi:protein-glutamine gamma-glutamyltransferase
VLRTAAVCVLPGVLIAAGWLRLEHGGPVGEAIGLVALAMAPALVRPWWARGIAALVAAAVAVRLIFGLSIAGALSREAERELFASLASAFREGSLRYFEVAQPFLPAEQPLMHAVLLSAIFGFCLAFALLVAARRPLAAGLVLVAGAAWPATLVAGADLALGAFLLASILVLLAAGGERWPRSWRPVAAATVALVAVGVVAGTQPAVAKSEFVSWRDWDFYEAPDEPVGVRYVWDANYGGISFPEKKTTVLTIEGPRRGHYWRATALDTFTGHRWVADREVVLRSSDRVELTGDPLFPNRGRTSRSWTEATVTVQALRDDHLVAPTMAAAYEPGDLGLVEYRTGGVAVLPRGLERGHSYTVWSYAPRPTPEQLAEARSTSATSFRRTAEERYLEVARGVPAPPFGEPERERQLETLFTTQPRARSLAPYRELYLEAQRIVGSPDNPYAATVALEAWFRSGGGFTYDEQPPLDPLLPPLVYFALDSKRGYCQQYAGAMALMLRYLGIPARVAAGFTSGSWDEKRERWTITNHDAHAWVEVWFEGWGWIPFDPTPARGQLSGQYSVGSLNFAQGAVEDLIRGTGGAAAGLAAGDGIRSDRNVGADGNPFLGEVPGEGQGGAVGAVAERAPSLLRLVLVLALGLAGLIVAAKLAIRRSRYLTRDPRRLAGACRSELVEILLDQGVTVSRSATLAELADLAQTRLLVDADRFAHVAARARFAPPRQARVAAREARRELRALRRLLRRRIGAGRLLRGLLSVRSLGFN